MHRSISLMFVSLGLVACFPDPPTGGGGGGGGGTPDAGGNPCTPTTADGNAMPGFPYDVADFNANILPPLRAGCLLSPGCHGPGNSTRFTVEPETGSTSTCPDVASFNSVVAQSNYMQGGTMSPLVQKINGTLPHAHPATSPASMEMTTLLTTFIDTAKTAFEEGGGGGGGGDAAFDRGVFSSQIQPVLAAGCIGSCHNATSGSPFGNFALNPMARANTPELEANVKAVVAKIDLTLDPTSATQTKMYVKATDNHSSSPISDTTARGNLEAWIAAGLMGQ